MKSQEKYQRFSFSKVFALSLSLTFILTASCTTNQSTEQSAKLPSDQEITQTIRSQFETSSNIPADSIDIETKDGIVKLNGRTNNLLAKKEAKKVAQSTYGVLAVVNNLKITATRPDKSVDRDMDRALATDAVIESWDVTSEVENGIVTLEGRVDTWQEKQLAATVASRVKGVKDVNNNLIVNYDQTRSEEEIKSEIERTLKMSSRVNADMVNVSVKKDTVTLSGAIGSAHEKSIAQNLARVTGVEAVDADLLEVHPEYENAMYQNNTIESLTASEIKRAINDAMRYDPRVPEDKISVTIDGNTAILEGSVLNLNSKLAAGNDALNTAGVTRVQNNIEVKRKVIVEPDVATTDKALKERLRYSIMRDPYVDKTAVTVNVKNGIATISGKVDSEFEKDQLNQIASNVKGIIAVNNNAKVATSSLES